jgi:hypothetical protein
MGKPKKYAAVSGAKKDFLTVAKIARSDHFIRDLLSRLWRGSMPLHTTQCVNLTTSSFGDKPHSRHNFA